MYRRGEVVHAELPIPKGTEFEGDRPLVVVGESVDAVIVQNDAGNKRGRSTIVAVVVSHLSPDKPLYPFQVALPHGGTTGLSKPSIANCAHLVTISFSRIQKRLGQLPPDSMVQVERALKVALGLK